MNTWSIFAWLAGIIGVGGAAALVAFIATGGLPMLAGGLVLARFIPSPAGIWRFLTSPAGKVALAALACLGCWLWADVRATRRERAACEERIQASVKAAREFDARLASEQHAKAVQQQQEAEARVAAAEQKVVDYEQTHKSCNIGDDAADWLNGEPGGVRAPPGRILPNPPKPPRRP